MSGASPRRTGRTPYRDLSPGRRAGSRRRPASAPRRGSGSRSPSASPVDTRRVGASPRRSPRRARRRFRGSSRGTRSSSRRAATSKLLGRTAHRSLTRKSASSSIAVMFSISAVRDMVEISGSPYICVVSAVCARNARPLAIFLIGVSMQLYISWSAVTPSAPRNRFVRERERARMPIVAVDDTDSRERGMCTTYVGARLAERLDAAGGRVRRRLLVRLNPAVKHKTRGNAAVALHVSGVEAEAAFDLAAETVREFAAADDPGPRPASSSPTSTWRATRLTQRERPAVPPSAASTAPIPADVADFARRALRHRLSLDEALTLADDHGFRHAAFGSGGDEYGGRRRARPDRRARGGRRPRSVRRLDRRAHLLPRARSLRYAPRRRYRERLRGRRPGIPDRLGHRRPRDGRGGLRPQRPRTDLTRDPRGRRQRVSRDRRGSPLSRSSAPRRF